MVKNIVVACDGSEQSLHALAFAGRLCNGDYKLHLITVLPPLTYLVSPAAPIATAGAVAAVTHQWEAQRRADEAAASETLKQALERCHTYGIKGGNDGAQIALHILPAAGGASGIAASIVEFSNKLENAVTVLGSRGYGAFTRSVMGLVGLGSVGDYCVHNLASPVIITKEKTLPRSAQEAAESMIHKVCVCVDDSQQSHQALKWALDTLVNPNTELHVISVASPVSLPVWSSLIDEATVAVASMQSRQWEEDKRQSLAAAEGCCASAIDVALAHDVPRSQLYWKALMPEGGASDVAESVIHYARDNQMSICVLGSHGYGAWKRSIMSFVGLGSVSDYCVHNLPCAVAVVKSPSESRGKVASQ